jgi:AcrR family transcriptional regulator
VATRQYRQRLRAEAAEETRRHILDTLYERMRFAPTSVISVEEIAKLAGVARSTIYLIFGSRAGLFHALYTDVLRAEEYKDLLEAVYQPDPLALLRDGIRATVRMYAKHADVQRVYYRLAGLAPDTAPLPPGRAEDERRGGMRRLASTLAEHGLLRPDLTVEDAEHILWVITSFDAFDQLFSGRGLSAEKTADLLLAMAERSVCKIPKSHSAR